MVLTTRFEAAMSFANFLHDDQKRKGSDIPYISHLLATAAIALEHGANEDEAIAAVLHDAVEDAPSEIGGEKVLKMIQRRFGDVVGKIVEGCSDSRTQPKPPWKERKEAYLKHLEKADFSVRLVSGSDKLHNAQSILRDLRQLGDKLWERFKGGKEGTLWYYRTLMQVYKKVGPVKLAEELALVVDEIGRIAGK